MTDINRAKELFQSGEYTCVLCKDGITHTSTAHGISPMLGFITDGIDLRGFSAADKIVGKAAALLFVSAGIIEIYAELLSAQAVKVFEKHNIKYSHQTLTDAIINRTGTDLCPMEKCVHTIENPSEAIDAIRTTLNFLQMKKMENAQ